MSKLCSLSLCRNKNFLESGITYLLHFAFYTFHHFPYNSCPFLPVLCSFSLFMQFSEPFKHLAIKEVQLSFIKNFNEIFFFLHIYFMLMVFCFFLAYVQYKRKGTYVLKWISAKSTLNFCLWLNDFRFVWNDFRLTAFYLFFLFYSTYIIVSGCIIINDIFSKKTHQIFSYDIMNVTTASLVRIFADLAFVHMQKII